MRISDVQSCVACCQPGKMTAGFFGHFRHRKKTAGKCISLAAFSVRQRRGLGDVLPLAPRDAKPLLPLGRPGAFVLQVPAFVVEHAADVDVLGIRRDRLAAHRAPTVGMPGVADQAAIAILANVTAAFFPFHVREHCAVRRHGQGSNILLNPTISARKRVSQPGTVGL